MSQQVSQGPARASTSLNAWGDKDYLIAPSILSADFAKLGEEVDNVLEAGADVVHFDVMDNHYVPNLTIGPMVCSALRKYGIEAPIDVHLMVSPVDKIIGEFADAGASFITFHPEATEHVDRSLQLVRAEQVHHEAPLKVLEAGGARRAQDLGRRHRQLGRQA